MRMAQVQPVWTKYFEFPPAAEEEDSASVKEDNASGEEDRNEKVHKIASC